MSETVSTGEATASTETPSTESTTPETTPDTQQSRSVEEYEALVKSLREEAAANRVKGKEKAEAAKAEVTAEFEAKLAEANTAHDSTKTKLAQAQLVSSKTDVALEAVLGAEQAARVRAFAKTLQGTNADELKAHAEELTKLFNTAPASSKAVDPTQGMGTGKTTGTGDQFTDFMVGLFDQKQ